MPRFHVEVDVECETLEQAEAWADHRLDFQAKDSPVKVSEEGPLVTANPKGQLPAGDPEYLQVMMVHAQMIAMFQEWVTAHGWVLEQTPRFDIPAHHYTVTHYVKPNAAAMRAAGFPVPERTTTDD